MIQKTKTLTARIIDNLSKNSTAAAIEQTNKDFKNSLLIVSISINIFAYDSQVASVLLMR